MLWLYTAILFIATIVMVFATDVRRHPKHWTKCAWCKVWCNEFGDTQIETPHNVCEPISHGICPECFENEKQKLKIQNQNPT